MKRRDAAEEASKSPPSCLDGFSHKVLPLEVGDFEGGVSFALRCRKCGDESFQIFGYPQLAPDPSPYAGLEPGEVFFRPPHGLVCTKCRTRAPLFDIRTQGYDAILNKVSTYESGGSGEAPAPGAYKVIVSIYYNIELEELLELAGEAGVKPADLFDSIGITGVPIGGGEPFEVSYECA